ncbi:hypothetical protein HPB51_020567 [Rhipicephalus microplus]|uniref:Uncharacterized protein n=1 Tax=Rhipicephalus microplus TaxID=6941 RepID=A0A9J6DX45_RHIMP|nr:hypothetical protein HPB51_020567 [Rhipicephalus microplus]
MLAHEHSLGAAQAARSRCLQLLLVAYQNTNACLAASFAAAATRLGLPVVLGTFGSRSNWGTLAALSPRQQKGRNRFLHPRPAQRKLLSWNRRNPKLGPQPMYSLGTLVLKVEDFPHLTPIQPQVNSLGGGSLRTLPLFVPHQDHPTAESREAQVPE